MSYLQLAVTAILESKEYVRGTSRVAIKRFAQERRSGEVQNRFLRAALKKAVELGFVEQHGARFKLVQTHRAELRRKKATKPVKKKTTKKTTTKKKKSTKKKAASTGNKKTSTKKKTTKKKTATKKTTKKKTTTKKKATKKKGTAPKKAPKKKATKKKTAVKKTTTKKQASKKQKHSGKDERPPLLRRQSSVQLIAGAVMDATLVIEGGVYYDANLAVVNMATNTDKFFKLQILKGGDGSYSCVSQWGRTGSEGQSQSQRFDTLAEAKSAFEKKFKGKAGAPFSERDNYKAKAGKYSFKKVNYKRVEKEGAAGGKATWQYYVSDGVDGKATGWYDYIAVASETVEGVYGEWVDNRKWLSVRNVQSGHWAYEVDFNKMTQTNISTKKCRQIRRGGDEDNEARAR